MKCVMHVLPVELQLYKMDEISCHLLVPLMSLDIVMKYLNTMIVQVPMIPPLSSFEMSPIYIEV